MTTIAFDGKFIAADRKAHRGNYICQKPVKKIFRLKNDFVISMSGSGCSQFDLFKKWVEEGMKGPAVIPKNIETVYISISPKGKIWEYTLNWQSELMEDKIYAWGSGRDYALGALHAGKNAATAVSIASKLDTFTGGGVDVFQIR